MYFYNEIITELVSFLFFLLFFLFFIFTKVEIKENQNNFQLYGFLRY